MRRHVVVLLTAVLVAAGLLLPGPSAGAAKTYTRAELKARADVIAFEVSLPRFTAIYRDGTKSAIDRRFAWENYDGCTVPAELSTAADPWRRQFLDACNRHDFGYRNFGNGLALGSDQAHKSRIDRAFYTDMSYICRTRLAPTNQARCRAGASAFYNGVRLAGRAQTAFFARSCPVGRFCLFDDHSYGDRRIALSASEDNMRDVDFGDKASSVMNRTSSAWIIYDDKDYADRRFCLPPGVGVRDLGVEAMKFNDKTSSARRAGSASCPSGTPVIEKG